MSRSPAAVLAEVEAPQLSRVLFDSRSIHSTATIAENARLGEGVRINAFAVIDDGAEIGDDVEIGAYVYVGPMVRIGAGSVLHPHVTIRDFVRIGNNVEINCGAVVGSDGFGFANSMGTNHKIPQIGTVEIEDDVWIGSNVTIDRATLGVTRIRRGARIDNLVQIGHNVEVGEETVLRPQVGIAGSATIGAGCQIGEKTGINGHIEIGDNVNVRAFSGVHRGLDAGASVMGAPAKPVESEMAIQKIVLDLPNMVRDFQRLKRKLTSWKS